MIVHHSKTYEVKTTRILSPTVSGVQEFGSSSAGCLLRISQEVAVKSLVTAAASEALTRAIGFSSKMAQSHGCWQKATVPCHLEVSMASPA